MPELSGAVQDRPQSSLVTRLKITGTLAAIGGVCGAVAGGALTYLGHVVTGYPRPCRVRDLPWKRGNHGRDRWDRRSLSSVVGAANGPPLAGHC